ncbi:MAG: SusC/RagA family TonB-linked outer membrane protein [Lewinellaceae bacterium]|nr:SusC/RagA family TonB-linked outer membrane protein [Lewinellaceae bacterium]
MKMFFTKIHFVMILMVVSISAFGQRTISGTVTDAESKEPLIGANILVKGTSSGTITDFDGNYSLDVPSGSDVLIFSYTGYSSQEITIGSSNVINVSLSVGALLDEVVVIGYGTVKKSDLTGSVAKVGEESFNRGAITSPQELLEGRTAGIQIVGASGAPGAATKINIRGTSSIRSGNDPLIVIDGIQLDNRSVEPGGDVLDLGRSQGSNPFAFIDPNEIASIEVLKDASATAIYGSRGANGVILITTKKGQNGKPTIEYTVQQGMSNILRRPDYLTGDEFRAGLKTEGLTLDNDFGDNVDAMDAILRTGYTNSHSLSVNGGGDKYNYRVFGSLFDQTGIIINSGLTKYTGGLKASFKALKNDRLTIDLGLTASKVSQEDAPISDDSGYEGSLIGAALQWNPTKPLIKADGSYDQDILEARNPLALSDYIRDRTNTTRILGNLGATFRIVKGLDYKFNVSVDEARGERRFFANPALNFSKTRDIGQAQVGNNHLGSTQITHTLNYQAQITSGFSLNLLGGYEYLKYSNQGTKIIVTNLAKNFPLDYTDILQSAANVNQRAESFHDPDVELQSYFARGIFNFGERYLITATIRADGSSKFGENNKYGYFPSFAAAWNIHNESFAPGAFDNLRLRLGWGVTGNQEFPAGAAQEYFVYDQGNLTQKNNPSPDLRWESSSQLNAGIDFAIMDYRISGTIDYFQKKTNDLILFVPLAQPNPNVDSRIYRNVDGTITNSGLELGLNFSLVEKRNLSWGLNLNGTYLTNQVDGFGTAINTGGINGQGLTGAFSQRIADGQPLFAYYLPVWEGLNAEGLSIYQDPVNGGTTLIATVSSVKQFVGDPLPDFLLGISTDLKIGNFDVMANLSGAFGYQVYNNTTNAVFVKGNIANGRNVTADLVGNGESINNSYPASTRYLENGDHVRLSNVTLGYTFANLPGFLKGARLAVTGQNLLLITGYSGFDPVVNTNKEISGIPSFGIEYTPYPTSRTFLASLSIKF